MRKTIRKFLIALILVNIVLAYFYPIVLILPLIFALARAMELLYIWQLRKKRDEIDFTTILGKYQIRNINKKIDKLNGY